MRKVLPETKRPPPKVGHSEAQLGNALTKAKAKELELFYQMGHQWKIVNDDNMRSARKRRQDGLEQLESSSKPHETAH